ncbi:alpha/beta fold hydrolase [Amycolatopsis sp. cg5]|uniref:alpha/beta fold hydrolase n=1 Tax=Amycolatopsis sp. cg5 TaxID=3238802 RepID=UPI0035249B77
MITFGGQGRPIVLLHGLMGRARTWSRVARWLEPYGQVFGLDAAGHGHGSRGGPWETERFADDVAALVRSLGAGPAVVIGHSMGGLHAWAFAARHPSLALAVVSEDFAPDQRGRTIDPWKAHFEAWPVPFGSLDEVRAYFGSLGDYFADCFEERADGYHLIADLPTLYEIASEWGRRDYWSIVDSIKCPLLVVEGEHTLMPPGQQAEVAARVADGRHLVVAGAGHVVHEDAPWEYRGAVEAFLSEVLAR